MQLYRQHLTSYNQLLRYKDPHIHFSCLQEVYLLFSNNNCTHQRLKCSVLLHCRLSKFTLCNATVVSTDVWTCSVSWKLFSSQCWLSLHRIVATLRSCCFGVVVLRCIRLFRLWRHGYSGGRVISSGLAALRRGWRRRFLGIASITLWHLRKRKMQTYR